MNELLPYEKPMAQKLANAPLPVEDQAWDAMRRMLEEDKDEDVIVPPPGSGCLRGAAGLILLALVAITAVIAYKITTAPKPGGLDKETLRLTDSLKTLGEVPPASGPNDLVISFVNPDTIKSLKNETASRRVKQPVAAMSKNGVQAINSTVQPIAASKEKPALAGISTSPSPKAVGVDSGGQQPNDRLPNSLNQKNPAGIKADSTAITVSTANGNKPSRPNGPLPRKKDAFDSTSPKITDPNATTESVKPWFGAGIALQQLLPVDGQKATPYNAEGRKSSLGDYIPSAYFRVYHGKKFLQVEFKYGAPQYTKDILYSKTPIHTDTSTGVTTYTANRVEKTYYHQLPISIHYIVLPNFSIGAGVVWNFFKNAVVEHEQGYSIASIGVDSILGSSIQTVTRDSTTAFAKSYLQFMTEAQYTYKRLSIGARYAWGLQPYLTFISPVNGQQQKERNASLNIFLRYELWRSKKK